MFKYLNPVSCLVIELNTVHLCNCLSSGENGVVTDPLIQHNVLFKKTGGGGGWGLVIQIREFMNP